MKCKIHEGSWIIEWKNGELYHYLGTAVSNDENGECITEEEWNKLVIKRRINKIKAQ